ncbi:MAG: hypothetical protein K6E86_03880 [Bacteroidales bacterium]|nr:hypothetical protein [Bacteroidales bacterium]
MNKTISTIILAALSAMTVASAQVRRTLCLEEGWRAVCYPEDPARYGDSIVAEDVMLPHNFDDYYGARQLLHGNLHGTAIYDIKFVAPRCLHPEDVLYRLRLEGAGTYVTVVLNGDTLCRRRPSGRIVTTLDLPRQLHSLIQNSLRIVCEHPSRITDMPWVCGGCSSEWGFSEGSQPLGLYRAVQIEELHQLRLAPFGVHVWSNAACDTLYVESEVENDNKSLRRKLSLETTLMPWGQDSVVVCRDNVTFALRNGERTVIRQAIPVGKDIKRWSPDEPNLYTVRTAIRCKDQKSGLMKVYDELYTEFGFRTVEWGRQLKINGQPVLVNGICEYEHSFGHSHALTEKEIDYRTLLVKKLGYNSFRDGHQPHNLRYMRNWNRLGITCWTQFSAHIWYDTPAFRETFKTLMRQWVKERRNDPSVVLWGLQNESTLPREFAEECTAIIKEMDPDHGRLVTTCNGGTGTDWNVVQNWSGTYGGKLEKYGEELKQENQLLNGEYGAWRTVGLHDTLTIFNSKAPHSEEKFSMLLRSKMDQTWAVRDSVCGQYLWLMYSHDNPGRYQPDEALRLIDKVGPYNYKGLYTIWGQPTDFARQLLNDTLKTAEQDSLGMQLLRGTPDMVYLYRYNCGGDSLVDDWGQLWMGDDTRFSTSWAQRPCFAQDSLCPVLASQGVADGPVSVAWPDGRLTQLPESVQPLVGTFRWGRHALSFRFPVQADRSYRIDVFHFEPWEPFIGAREYDIAVNGQIETHVDIVSVSGGRNRLVRSTMLVNSGKKDYLEITFPRVQNGQAVVSAIAISTTARIAETLQCPEVPATPGYPYSEGLTWAMLDAMTLAVTPKGYFPNYDANLNQQIKADAQPQADGTVRFEFATGLAHENVMRLRYKNVTGATVDSRWELRSKADNRIIAQGTLALPVTPPKWKFVSTTTGSMVNAGDYVLIVYPDKPVEFENVTVE